MKGRYWCSKHGLFSFVTKKLEGVKLKYKNQIIQAKAPCPECKKLSFHISMMYWDD